MASETTFLTTPAHAKIVADSATDDNDNRHNVLDQRLETFWQPDLSGGAITMSLDLNVTTGISISHFGLWIANYDSLAGDVDIQVLESDTDGSGYASLGASSNITFGIGGLFFFELDTVGTKRYLRFAINSSAPSAPYPEVSGIFFLTERTVAARPKFPIVNNTSFFNKTYNAGGGQQYVTAETLNYIVEFTRNFTLTSQANNTILENVFIDLAGRRRLFIYQEGTTLGEAYLCRMDLDKPNIVFKEYDFYEARLRFKQVPFIVDGEVM